MFDLDGSKESQGEYVSYPGSGAGRSITQQILGFDVGVWA